MPTSTPPTSVALRKPHVVSIGLIYPALLGRVSKSWAHQRHTTYKDSHWVPATDAAIVAATLAAWSMPVYLIANALGDDPLGREYVRSLRDYGVLGDLTLRPEIQTPLEMIVVDPDDQRLWLEPDTPETWRTLGEADLSPLDAAAYVYVDWYALDQATAAVDRALACRVPLFVNLGRSGWQSDLPAALLSKADYLQASCDEGSDPHDLLRTLVQTYGVKEHQRIVVTRGRHGCLGATQGQVLEVVALPTAVSDTNGAGATFSAGCIAGSVLDMSFERQLRFATVAAAAKISRPGVLDEHKDALLSRIADVAVTQRA